MALWENVIGYGTHAERPAAGSPGALYCESDTGLIVRDNGTSWDSVATALGAYTVSKTAVNLTVAAGNTLVVCQADGLTITLPDAATNAGLGVDVSARSHTGTVVAAAGSDTVAGGASDSIASGGAIVYRSDGADWPRVATD